MASATTSPSQDCCCLVHRAFTMFGDPLFRRAESDGAPVMVVHLGEKEAAIPLVALKREFGIEDASDDGRMLDLVVQALDFIAGLRIGDPLPPEVLSGQASWEPDAVHLRIANARLQWQLVTWLNSGTGEALRDRLLRRAKVMAEKLNRIAKVFRGDASHLETLTQVRRLAATALKQISRRFDELDAQTGEVMSALRNADSQRTFIRSNRDWLYRTQRAWQSLLSEWELAGIGFDEGILQLLNRTYQFLAVRFMPVTEWTAASHPKQVKDMTRRMVW